MATHDYIISNASGAAVRADLNNALAAIATNNSSATEPTTTYAYQWWADTGSSPTVMKLRNAANSAWITLFQLDGEWTVVPFENGTAAAPSIYFKDSGTDTGIYSPGTDQVGISAGGTSRFEVSTTATTSTLPVVHPLGAVGTPSITFTGDLNTGIYSPAADTLAFVEGGAEVARIDSSARLLIGTSTARTNFYDSASLYSPGVQLETAGSVGTEPNRFLSLTHGNAGTLGPVLLFAKHRSNSVGGNTVVASGDEAGQINFQASDGSEFVSVAGISANVDGTPGAGDMPGRLVFATTADGASTTTERMRIQSNGVVRVGDEAPSNTNSGTVAAKGYHSRTGLSGGFGPNVFNIYWDTTAAKLWIDATDLGSISVSSDYRIKKSIEDQTETAAERVKLLRPVKYEYTDYGTLYKADGIQREGFIAHELAEVIPSAVDGEKDAPNQIQTLRLDALCSVLTKALQESIERIETLEAKVAALEAA
jgi:hypothetical protein